MPLLFFIFGLASVALVILLVGSLVAGLLLQRTERARTLGLFVLFVPTLASIGAGSLSWGLAFWADAKSHAVETTNVGAWQRWQVLAFWAWPFGFGVGAIVGAALGGLLIFLIKRRRNRLRRQ